MWKNSIANDIKKMAEDNKRLEGPARELGELGWTIPIWAPPRIIPQLLNDVEKHRIDEFFVTAYQQDNSKRFRAMIKDLKSRQVLKSWHPLIEECGFSFDHHRFRIVIPSLILILSYLYR